LQVQAVRFSNLCYFFAQPSDALSDGLLHRDRLAERGNHCGSIAVCTNGLEQGMRVVEVTVAKLPLH